MSPAAGNTGSGPAPIEHNAAAAGRFEHLGFTWCKIGSIGLIALFPKPAVLLASGLAVYFYARAAMLGVNRSDCILRHPLVIMAFWSLVMVLTLASLLWSALADRFGLPPIP